MNVMADVEAIDNVFNEYIKDLYRGTEHTIVQITDPDTIPKEVHLIKVSCIRCHHLWYIRRDKFPKVCASCTSRYWNSPTKRELGFEYFGKRVYD